MCALKCPSNCACHEICNSNAPAPQEPCQRDCESRISLSPSLVAKVGQRLPSTGLGEDCVLESPCHTSGELTERVSLATACGSMPADANSFDSMLTFSLEFSPLKSVSHYCYDEGFSDDVASHLPAVPDFPEPVAPCARVSDIGFSFVAVELELQLAPPLSPSPLAPPVVSPGAEFNSDSHSHLKACPEDSGPVPYP